MKKALFYLLFILSGYSSATTYTVLTIPNPKENGKTGFVSNPDGILRELTVSQLNNTFDNLEKETTVEVAVVAINSIGTQDIKSFATKLFEIWGIGKEDLDNGLLILFVLDQRSITFETGYGLEGILPDAICKRIQLEYMLPSFKNEDYDTGFLQASEYVSALIKEKAPPPVYEIKEATNRNKILLAITIYILLTLIPFLIFYSYSKETIKKARRITTAEIEYLLEKRRKVLPYFTISIYIVAFCAVAFYYPSWENFCLTIPIAFTLIPTNIYGKRQLKRLKDLKRYCETCGNILTLIPEEEQKDVLKPSEQLEKVLGSVQFECFNCESCQEKKTLTYILSGDYSLCPNCRTYAFKKIQMSIFKEPTYVQEGTLRKTYMCSYCNHVKWVDSKIKTKEPVYHPSPSTTKSYSYYSQNQNNSDSSHNKTTEKGYSGKSTSSSDYSKKSASSYNNSSSYSGKSSASSSKDDNYYSSNSSGYKSSGSQSSSSNNPASSGSDSGSKSSFGGGRSGGGGATSSW